MDLDERKLRILKAVIDDYIATALPIGSRTISKKYEIGYSSATIRNEMSDLEEMGYLDQPHTSAGRVPSGKAYRWYVDQIIKDKTLTKAETEEIKSYFNVRIDQAETVFRRAAKALSDITNYTSLVVAPGVESVIIKHVQLVPIAAGRALMVVVTDSGVLKDIVIRVPDSMTPAMLENISRLITGMSRDLSPSQIAAGMVNLSGGEMGEHRALIDGMLSELGAGMGKSDAGQIVMEGTKNILNYPEYQSIEKVKDFFGILERKDPIASMIAASPGLRFTVKIGDENELEELKDCSVITAMYRIGQKGMGTLGIIGPTRMNYTKVISVLVYMGDMLSDILKDI